MPGRAYERDLRGGKRGDETGAQGVNGGVAGGSGEGSWATRDELAKSASDDESESENRDEVPEKKQLVEAGDGGKETGLIHAPTVAEINEENDGEPAPTTEAIDDVTMVMDLTPDAWFMHLMQLATAQPSGASSEEWEQGVDEIFQAVYSSMTFGSKRHKADDGYPDIDQEEAQALMQLFHVFAKTQRRELADWVAIMKEVCRVLHQPSWKMTHIVLSIADRLRLGTSELSGPWGRMTTAATMPNFVIDPQAFDENERKEIFAYCKKPFEMAAELRAPTGFEWKIMIGMTEGTIVARHLSQFLRRVSSGENLLRFQFTIEAQVQGHLVGKLNDSTQVYNGYQSTKRLVEVIMLALRQRREITSAVSDMLKDLKKLEYHQGSHSLHFYFFARETADKWTGSVVPFRRLLLVLGNAHAKTTEEKNKSVWQRQHGDDSIRNSAVRFRYKVQLLNVTSMMDPAAFFAILKNKLEVEFLAYSMDRYGTTSDHSLFWEVQFETSACPPKLVDVQRIYWVEHAIQVHHASVHKDLPCHFCGGYGHVARGCTVPEGDLRTKNYLIIGEAEATKVDQVKVTFLSSEEMKLAYELSRRKTKSEDKNEDDKTDGDKKVGDKKDEDKNEEDKKNKTDEGSPADPNAEMKSGGAALTQPEKEPKAPKRNKSKKKTNVKRPAPNSGIQPHTPGGAGANPIVVDDCIQEQPSSVSGASLDSPSPPATDASAPHVNPEDIKWEKKTQRLRKELETTMQEESDRANEHNSSTDEVMDWTAQFSTADTFPAIGVKQSNTPANGNCQFLALAEAGLQQSVNDLLRRSLVLKTTRKITAVINAAARAPRINSTATLEKG